MADHGHVGQVSRKAVRVPEQLHDGGTRLRPDLPSSPTAGAVKVAVFFLRSDMEFLSPVGPVAMADEPDLLKEIEGAVHGGWDGGRVDGATALDQLDTRDVASRCRKHRDHGPALRCPAHAPVAEPLPHARPGFAECSGREHGR